MGTLLPNAVQTFTGPNGTPLSGGSVYFYIPGTTTPKNTWQDPAQTILNTNPVILNANGQAIIWGTGAYRQQVYDANNNLIWDQVTEDTSGGIIGNMTDNPYLSGSGFTPGTTTQLTLSTGPGSRANTWVYFDGVYQAPDTYSVSGTTVTFNSAIPVGTQEVNIKVGSTLAIGTPSSGTVIDSSVANPSKLYFRINEWVDPRDPAFGAKGDGVTDDTVALQAAENFASAQGIPVYFGAWFAVNTTGITKQSGSTWIGAGKKLCGIRALSGTWANSMVSATTLSKTSIFNIGFDFSNGIASGNPACIAINSFNSGEIANCDFQMTPQATSPTGGQGIGIEINGGTNFQVHHNTISRASSANYLNEGIWITASTSTPQYYEVTDNILQNTGTDFSGSDSIISRNDISGWGYGAGITIEQGATRLIIDSNRCSFSANVLDSNSYTPAGIENWASYSQVTNNQCHYNAGAGIHSGGAASVVTGNSCVNNGQYSGAGVTTNYRCGIISRYVSVNFNGGSSLIANNNCVDTGGGTQLWGYTDDGASVAGVALFDNILFGATAPMSAGGTRYDFKGPKLTASFNNSGFTVNAGTVGGSFAAAINGAQPGDKVTVSISQLLNGVIAYGWVTSAGNVEVSFFNPTGSNVTIANYTAYVAVEKPFGYSNY